MTTEPTAETATAEPLSNRVLTGTLDVPKGLPPGVLAFMDQEFREILWPPAKAEGYARLSREFRWSNAGRTLHYRIVDVPINPEGGAERAARRRARAREAVRETEG
jgi:hypothetical protein